MNADNFQRFCSRRFLRLWTVLLACCPLPRAVADELRPNVLLILADDLGAKDVGCYGGAFPTPHIDRLAREGVRFRMCYTSPICTPSRVMLMTGRYGFRTGWLHFFDNPGAPRSGSPEYDFGRREITVADLLEKRGYRNGVFGHWALPSMNLATAVVDSGFHDYSVWPMRIDLSPLGPLPEKFGPGLRAARYWDSAVLRDGRPYPTGKADFGPDVHTGHLLEFMRSHRDRPFLAYCSTLMPHIAYPPLPAYPDVPGADGAAPGHRQSGSLAAHVIHLDAMVGRMVTALEELGLRERTIVVLTADNGTEGQGKGTATELGARVPMIVMGPGVKRGIVSDALIDHSDLLPTLAELTGATLPADRPIDGRSFSSILQGRPGQRREWIFSFIGSQRVIRTRDCLREGDGEIYASHGADDVRAYERLNGEQAARVRASIDPVLAKLPIPAGLPGGIAHQGSWEQYVAFIREYWPQRAR